MATELNPTATTAPSLLPEGTVVERQSVPASALFSDDERTFSKSTEAASPAIETTAVPAEPAKPATPATPAATTEPVAAPVAVPAEPAKPATPATPAATPAAAPAPAPATPAPEPKINVGGKEYTKAELEAKLAERSTPAPSTPAAQPTPAPAAPKPPTAEEIITNENSWVENFTKQSKINFAPSAEEMETILSGGEDAAKLLANKLNEVAARAVLLARKSIYEDMNPVLKRFEDSLQPVLASNSQVEAAAAEQVFFNSYPEFKSHADTVRQVGEALLARFPAEMAAMTYEQKMKEVASQADRILQAQFKQWAPNSTGTWRDSTAAPAPVVTAAPAPTTAAPASVVTAAPAPTTAAPAIKPPNANSPASIPSGGATPDWSKSTAKSLVD